MGAVTARLHSAVEATEGVTLWYRGRPATVFYSGHCGGRTVAAGELWPRAARPYLVSVPDSFCLSGGRGAWNARLSWADLARALGLRALHSLDVDGRSASGRVVALRSDVGRLGAEQLHLAVGRAFGWNLLRSQMYEVRATAEHVLFDGSGSGHGVGLCQMGAEERGRAGHTFEQILGAYFPGTRAGVTAQDIPCASCRANRWRCGAQPPVTSALRRRPITR